MNNKFCTITFMLLLVFAACSENEDSSGISIEPNALAGVSSSAEEITSSSSEEKNIKDKDIAFIDSIFHLYGTGESNGAEASGGDEDWDDPSEGDEEIDIPEDWYDPSKVKEELTTAYVMPKDKDSIYVHISQKGACTVNIDRQNGAVQIHKSNHADLINLLQTVFIIENDGSHFLLNLLYALYRSEYDEDYQVIHQKSCLSFVEDFTSECGETDCFMKKIRGCNVAQMLYIKKVPADTTIDEIASIWKNECEQYVLTLPDPPTRPGETCRFDSNSGEKYCETTSK